MTKVYIIKQYQPSSDCNGEPIAVFNTLEQALRLVKKLNKKFAENVEFGDNYFSFYPIDDFKEHHAYIIETFELNREIPYL